MLVRRSIFLGTLALGALIYGGYELSRRSGWISQADRESDQVVALPRLETGLTPVPLKDRKLIQISRRSVDFGRVPVRYPATQRLSLVNRSDAEVRVRAVRVEPPFGIEQETLTLEPHVPADLEITFDPAQPGSYEKRVTLVLDGPVEQELQVIVRGQGILAPVQAAGEIPPPPDAVARKHRAMEMARLLAEARAASSQEKGSSRDGKGSAEPPAQEGDESAEEGSDQPREAPASDAAGARGRAAAFSTMVAAFGEALDPGNDVNNTPGPIPEGETRPDLPPSESDDDAPGQQDEQEGQEEGQEEDAGGSGAEGDDESARRDDDKPKKKVPIFTLAPNSSVLVFSSKEWFDFQAYPLMVSEDQSRFELNARIRFPDLALAFGERVSLEQWGNILGTLAPDGNVEMDLVLRIHDPAGTFLDLPVKLTTRRAVGYSAEGRVMFANGIPRDPSLGDFKLVGITNIPVGQNSSLDRVPVYLEILGRLNL